MIGRILAGRYELGEVLGQGGMAVVYRATDRSLRRDVALKILREQYAADPEFVERFEREARAAARLSHPHVVDVYDVGADGETHFIVEELVEGENLKSLIRRAAPLPPAQVIRLGREIAAALDYAHRRGLVHRDVKPQNVLLDADGQAKLTDFGIAQAADAAGLTETGTVLGTAQYMAPEQARGRPASPASDVYSLGVVLYELATGRLPFSGDNPVAIALRHVEEDPVPPRRLNPSIPPALEAVILRAMAKDPARRFASAGQLAEALAGGPDPVRERTSRAAAVPDARAIPGGALGPTAVSPPIRRRPAPDPRLRARRPPKQGAAGGVVLLLLVLASLGALALGFNWLFGADRARPSTDQATPTSAPVVVASPTTAAAPTATRRPAPTATSVPPTATPAPPTATPAPPTPTSAPTARPTPVVVRVVVPKVVGLSLGAAQQQLAARDLIMEFREGNDVRQPDGVVIDQEPGPNASVPRGSVVKLVVNKLGPVPSGVDVPNVRGMEEGQARRTLMEAGFKVDVVKQDGGHKGLVETQSPEPGIKAPPGTVVKISVGS